MALCPQLPPSSPVSCHTYPSPRSKSPSPVTHFKASRKPSILKYPLTDITNSTLAQATLELSNFTPIPARDGRHLGRAREIPGDAPPRRGRAKHRRGRQRGVRPREVGDSISSGKVFRSPIPFVSSSPRSTFHPAFNFRVARRKSTPVSPILSTASFHKSSTNARPRTPRSRFPSVSAVKPQTPKDACKRTQRWAYNSPRGKFVSPSSVPSPTPTPTTRRPPRSNKPPLDAPSGLNQPHSPPLHFPTPPSAARPSHHSSPHYNYENQFSLPPFTNLGSGIAQGPVRKKRTKRDLAEVQWQITMHKSLAWRATQEHLNAEKQTMCEHCTSAKEDPSHGVMDFAQGGLKIAFERPACTCANGDEPQARKMGAQLHWTDSLDRELVKRLWVKLIAQGCRTLPTGISNPPQVSTPFPTVEHSQRGIPFPSEQPEQPLAPAIQLSSTSCPPSDSQMGSRVPLRQRVFAMASSAKTRSHGSMPNPRVSSHKLPTPATVSMPPSSSLTAHPPYSEVQLRVPARISRGPLSSAQLTAQAILRHGDARSKPMRRGRPPGIMQKPSSLRREVRAGHTHIT